MKLGFSLKYLLAFIAFFAVIVAIAIFVPGGFIRHHFGDILIVVFMYCFVRIFVRNQAKLLPLYIFAFATLVEIGQYFDLVYILGLENSRFARIIIGATFDPLDIAMYFMGCVLIFGFEMWREKLYGR